jgi:hypothetical protein
VQLSFVHVSNMNITSVYSLQCVLQIYKQYLCHAGPGRRPNMLRMYDRQRTSIAAAMRRPDVSECIPHELPYPGNDQDAKRTLDLPSVHTHAQVLTKEEMTQHPSVEIHYPAKIEYFYFYNVRCDCYKLQYTNL